MLPIIPRFGADNRKPGERVSRAGLARHPKLFRSSFVAMYWRIRRAYYSFPKSNPAVT